MRRSPLALSLLAVVGLVVLSGCDDKSTKSTGPGATTATKSTAADDNATEIAAERAKLSPEDRALVEAQEWCVVQTDERLGSMGPPVKLSIKGQPVFVCCGHCRKAAEKDPAATLAKLEEMKARARAEKGKKN
jgi:hypothetical protein